ncbi:MAG: NAD-binding protein [Sulfuricurvum sp.]|nr:NAD-binding protein [Sulfuricurvum sp.]
MKYQSAIVFGFNEYAKQIVFQISEAYLSFCVFVMNEEERLSAQAAGYDTELFDLSENWKSIEKRFDLNSLVVFCALDKDAENVFLTISLRSVFWHLPIIALAGDHESARKLKNAGANKVMPILQITANMISGMLEKPIVTKVMRDIIDENSPIKIVQITVPLDSYIIGKQLFDIDWTKEYNVIVLAVVDHEGSTRFSFTAHGHNHHIDLHDILVVVGDDENILGLSKAIGVIK